MGLPVFLRDGVAQRPGLLQTPWVGLRPPNLIFKHFTKSIIFYTPDLVTLVTFSPRLKNRETDKLEFSFIVILSASEESN